VLSQKKGSSLRFLNKPKDSPLVDIEGEERKATVDAECLSMAALREGLHRAARSQPLNETENQNQVK